MLGTLSWRIKEAFSVLTGKKKTMPEKRKNPLPVTDMEAIQEYVFRDQELADYIASLSIEFCFSEFGEERTNAGGAEFSGSRLDPSLSTLKKYFPNARYTVYSDFDLEIPGVNLKKVVVSPVPEKDHPRYRYRTADYFKFKSLLDSDADFKCVIDSDMFVVSDDIFRLVYLTEIFGACAPYNSRNLLKRDMQVSLDTQPISDMSNGFGHSYNQSPMTLWKNHEAGAQFFEACCKWMIKEPSRASRVMWNAANENGFSPYLLPAEFCVCAGEEGIGNEVMLHVGHPGVAEYYHIKM